MDSLQWVFFPPLIRFSLNLWTLETKSVDFLTALYKYFCLFALCLCQSREYDAIIKFPNLEYLDHRYHHYSYYNYVYTLRKHTLIQTQMISRECDKPIFPRSKCCLSEYIRPKKYTAIWSTKFVLLLFIYECHYNIHRDGGSIKCSLDYPIFCLSLLLFLFLVAPFLFVFFFGLGSKRTIYGAEWAFSFRISIFIAVLHWFVSHFTIFSSWR